MKKLLAFSLLSSSIFLSTNSVKADWDYWAIGTGQESYSTFVEEDNTHYSGTSDLYILYTVNSATGEKTQRQKFCRYNYVGRSCNRFLGYPRIVDPIDIGYPENHIDKDSFIIRETEKIDNTWDNIIHKKYTLNGNTLSSEKVTSTSEYWFDDYTYTAIRGAAQIDSDGNYYSDIGGQMWIKQTTDGTVSFGKTGNSTALYSLSETGVSQNGTNLISRSSDGVTSIGANSVKLQEVSDIQRIWATNSSGTKIPINIYGSDFQIDGVSVQNQIDTNKSDISTNTSNISTNTSNIKNLGEGVAGSTALTAALTALPQTSKESKLSCGVGTGAYSSRYALGFGCASKVNERVDINAGGSYVFGGSKSYGEGTLDNGVIKAGFVFKLGELKKSTQISMKEKEELKQEISDLKANNINIISQNKALLARLERLEKIALSETKSQDLASIKLP